MQMNSFSSVDIRCIHHWHHRNCHHLHIASDIMNSMFIFFFLLMATRVTLSGLHFQNDVSTLQRTKHLREVPLTAFGYVLKALYN